MSALAATGTVPAIADTDDVPASHRALASPRSQPVGIAFEFDATAELSRLAPELLVRQDTQAGSVTPSPPAPAPTQHAGTADLAAKLQNPIADLISVPLQFNWDTGIGSKDADRVWVNIQPVIPFSISDDWNVISRTILPVIYAGSPAVGVDGAFGIGDITQSFFFSPKAPVGDGWIVGVGPVLQLPTGTDDLFRTEQFSLGPTAVLLKQEHGWTYGALVNHLWNVIDVSSDADSVNATFLQPFVAYTWPSATTVGLNSESSYDWRTEDWTVPLNLMVSQLVRIGDQPVQFQIGGRYYAESPVGGPEWGLRFAVTFLFPG